MTKIVTKQNIVKIKPQTKITANNHKTKHKT